MQTAGFYLTIPGGGGDLVIPGIAESVIPARIRMGGADVLKVLASGAVLAFGGVPRPC